MHFQVIPVQYSTNNWQQNQLRLFSLKCPSEDLQVTKGKCSFPSPQMHCCAAVRATCKKTFKTATLNGGEDCGLFCSPNLPQLRTMSQQFCHQLKVDSEAPLFLFFLFVGRKKILVQCEGRLPSTLDTQSSSCYKSSSFSAQGKKNPFFIKMFDKIYK